MVACHSQKSAVPTVQIEGQVIAESLSRGGLRRPVH